MSSCSLNEWGSYKNSDNDKSDSCDQGADVEVAVALAEDIVVSLV